MVFSILRHWGRLFLELPAEAKILVILILGIFIFSIISVSYALYALRVHIRRARTENRKTMLFASWNEVLFEILSGDRLLPELHDYVAKGDELFFLDFLTGYTRRLKGFELQQVRMLAQPYMKKLESRLEHVDNELRARTIRTAGELGFDMFANRIRDAVRDESPLVRMVASQVLLRYGDLQDLELVLEHVHEYATFSRSYLATLISSTGDDAGLILRRVYGNSEVDMYTRAVCADALELMNDVEAVDTARHVLREQLSTDLAVSSLHLVRSLGDSRAVEEVKRHVQSDNMIVRAHALSAYGAIAGKEAVPILTAEISHPSPWVARHAVEGLLELGEISILQQYADSQKPGAVVAQQLLDEEGS
jgi:hypothetical protein